MALSKSDIVQHFVQRFGRQPQSVIRAPGRVNLIGEHTDYNDGFVMPLAIDRAAWIALQPRSDRKVVVHSVDYNETKEFSLDGLAHTKEGWLEYLKGTAWSLTDAGHKLYGWEGVLAGDVPLGAGLSSSAALEMATARAFAAVGNLPWDAPAMAILGQRAENKWVGVNCGIMDQMISAVGRENHAVLIDCRSLKLTPVPFPEGTAVVVLDTATRRGLVDSAYNERRACCEEAAKFFKVKALRDVSVEQFQKLADGLSPVSRRRAMHVITENDRTEKAAAAMQRGDAKTLGELMNQSHESLNNDFEVSSDDLNVMVENARRHPACIGARMTGAGFGGCAVALIDAKGADDFVRQTAAGYERQTRHIPAIYVCTATNGAAVV
jgi:galactokinase